MCDVGDITDDTWTYVKYKPTKSDFFRVSHWHLTGKLLVTDETLIRSHYKQIIAAP